MAQAQPSLISYLRDWTHWDFETYAFASQVWSDLNRSGADVHADDKDSAEFARLESNMDAWEDWWNLHDFAPDPAQ